MHQVKKLKISGFRRLHDIEIEMRPLMVMIGANGAGKTSFLENGGDSPLFPYQFDFEHLVCYRS